MSDEEAFLNRILSDLKDDTARLVYADWLEERGDDVSTAKAAFLRVQSAWHRLPSSSSMNSRLRRRLRQCSKKVDSSWLAMVSMLLIENCYDEFMLDCPVKWENLRQTDDLTVRICGVCKTEVRYCPSIRMARKAGYDQPVVVALSVKRKPGDVRSYASTMQKRHMGAALFQRKRIERQERVPTLEANDG